MATTAQRGIVLRLSTEGTEQVKAALKSLGVEGEAALRQLERGAQRVTPPLTALDTAAKRVTNSINSEFQKLASGIVGMISPVNLLIGLVGTAVGAVVGWVTSAVSGSQEAESATSEWADTVDRLQEVYGKAADEVSRLSEQERINRLYTVTYNLANETERYQRALAGIPLLLEDQLRYQIGGTDAAGFGQGATLIQRFQADLRAGNADVGAFLDAFRALAVEAGNPRLFTFVEWLQGVAGDAAEAEEQVANLQAQAAGLNGTLTDEQAALIGVATERERAIQAIDNEIAAHARLLEAQGQTVEATRDATAIREFLARRSTERIASLLVDEARTLATSINNTLAEAFGDPALADAAATLQEPMLTLFNTINAGTPDVLTFRAAIAAFANLEPENTSLQALVSTLLALTDLAAQLQGGLTPVTPPTRPSGGGSGAAAAKAEQRRLEQLARTVLQDVNPALAAELELQERLSDLAAIRAAELLSEADHAAAVSAAHRDYATALEEARLAQEGLDRSLRAGGIRALRSLADEALDAGGVIEQALTSAFRAAGSAFDDFLEGGEDSFRKFVEAILKDLARLAFQQGLALLAQGILGTLTAGGSGVGFFANLLTAIVSHDGGRVGEPMPTRQVSPSLFLSAPRLHTGLAADEFPAILQRGETVIPRGGNAGTVVQVINHSGGRVRQERSKTPDGRELVRIIIDAVAQNIADGGLVSRAIAQAAVDRTI